MPALRPCGDSPVSVRAASKTGGGWTGRSAAPPLPSGRFFVWLHGRRGEKEEATLVSIGLRRIPGLR
jgi:hypothetical protein